MPRAAWLFSPMLLAACSAFPETTGACSVDGLDHFKGALVNIDTARQIQLASGSRAVRWLGPRDIVTMEFRADRVNLILDESLHNIVDIRCG